MLWLHAVLGLTRPFLYDDPRVSGALESADEPAKEQQLEASSQFINQFPAEQWTGDYTQQGQDITAGGDIETQITGKVDQDITTHSLFLAGPSFKGRTPPGIQAVTFDFDGTLETADMLADLVNSALRGEPPDMLKHASGNSEDAPKIAVFHAAWEAIQKAGAGCGDAIETAGGFASCSVASNTLLTKMTAIVDAIITGVGGVDSFKQIFFGRSTATADTMRMAIEKLRTTLKGNVFIVSASWAPIPGAVWKGYLLHVLEKIGWQYIFPEANVFGIDDPGGTDPADKGAQMARIATDIAKIDAKAMVHCDDSLKYVLQALRKGGSGLVAWTHHGLQLDDITYLNRLAVSASANLAAKLERRSRSRRAPPHWFHSRESDDELD